MRSLPASAPYCAGGMPRPNSEAGWLVSQRMNLRSNSGAKRSSNTCRYSASERVADRAGGMGELDNEGCLEVDRCANNRAENSHLPLRRELAIQRLRQIKS